MEIFPCPSCIWCRGPIATDAAGMWLNFLNSMLDLQAIYQLKSQVPRRLD